MFSSALLTVQSSVALGLLLLDEEQSNIIKAINIVACNLDPMRIGRNEGLTVIVMRRMSRSNSHSMVIMGIIVAIAITKGFYALDVSSLRFMRALTIKAMTHYIRQRGGGTP